MDRKPIIKTLKEIFRDSRYCILALLVSVGAFAFSVWLPNFGLISKTIRDFEIPLAQKIGLLIDLLGGIETNFSLFSASYTILIDLLFGINVVMIVYYLRIKSAGLSKQVVAFGAGGMGSGILGIGCAACGSLILNSLLPLLGASGAIAILPLRGGEFGILSVILLFASIILVAKKLNTPAVCEPSLKNHESR